MPKNKRLRQAGKIWNYIGVVKDNQPTLQLTPTKQVNHMKGMTFVGEYPLPLHRNGKCTIVFHRWNDLEVTLSHAYLTNQLEADLHHLGKRLKEKEEFTMYLNHTKLQVTKQEGLDLFACLCEYYINLQKEKEREAKILCSSIFQTSKRLDCATQLMRMDRSLWNAMIKFAKVLDYRNGNSPLHIFESHDGMIKVPYTWDRKEYTRGFTGILIPEQMDSNLYDMVKADHYIYLNWLPISYYDNDRLLNHFDSLEKYNAKHAFNWLTNEFIPQVIYYSEKKNDNTLTYKAFLKSFDIERYIEVCWKE